MTQLRIIEYPDPYTAFNDQGWWGTEPGDMWLCKQKEHIIQNRLPCWIIRFPDKCAWWHTNWKSTSSNQYWNVIGEAPRLTITPSINIGNGIWHGWITDGMMRKI